MPTRDQSTADLLQHITDLRAALQHAIRLPAHSAGREAAEDPRYSGRLMAATEGMAPVLARTAVPSPAEPSAAGAVAEPEPRG
ncbi:hypothetical protein ACIOHE_04250 [Streptomyces sp. NPDC087851]|uniref:hypothetical protein n=1 Tax=Streptomyces sp. NPDC087851 TaxID=3365810 RepID=UPI0037F884C1